MPSAEPRSARHGLTCDLGRGSGDDEEAFAYVLGDLVSAVTDELYNRGIWSLTPPASS